MMAGCLRMLTQCRRLHLPALTGKTSHLSLQKQRLTCGVAEVYLLPAAPGSRCPLGIAVDIKELALWLTGYQDWAKEHSE